MNSLNQDWVWDMSGSPYAISESNSQACSMTIVGGVVVVQCALPRVSFLGLLERMHGFE